MRAGAGRGGPGLDGAGRGAFARRTGVRGHMKSAMSDCLLCSNPVEPGAKACSRCGAVFTPDAHAAKETVEKGIKESYKEAGRAGDSHQAIDDIEDVDELLENPAVRKALIEKLQED